MKQCTVLLALLAALFLVFQCRAQVTFSRDWSAGKRSILTGTDCTTHAHQSAALCQMLMNEIKHLTACEVRLLNHKVRDGSTEQIFRSPPGVAEDE